MKLSFSGQALALIESLKDFSEDEFIEWLSKHGVPIGSANVLQYICERDRLKNGKARAGKEVVINGK